MVAPLKASLFNVAELHSGGYIPATLNLDPNNKYSFKDPTFQIHFRTATGYIKGDEYYLLFTTQSNQIGSKELLEFGIKKGGKGQWEDDKETLQKLTDKWVEEGCQICVEVSSHPQLKALVKVLSEKRVLVQNVIQVVVAATQEQSDKLYQDWSTTIDYLINTATPTPTDPEYKLVMDLFSAKQYLAPYKSNDELPKKIQVTPFGQTETGEFQSVPFKGLLPYYDEVIFEAPKKWESNGGGRSTTVNGYIEPDARYEWIKSKLNDDEFVQWANTIDTPEKIIAFMVAMGMTGVTMTLPIMENTSKKNTNGTIPLTSAVPSSLISGLPNTLPG